MAVQLILASEGVEQRRLVIDVDKLFYIVNILIVLSCNATLLHVHVAVALQFIIAAALF